MKKPVVAAFDFDGTLSRGVSGMRFFRQIIGGPRYAWFWVRHFPSLLAYQLRWRHEAALARVNRAIFTGLPAARLAGEADRFWRGHIEPHLIPAAMERLRWHLAQGHRCVIVSRGYEVYLKPWAASVGVADVIATRLSVGADGLLTGEMPEASCDGVEKRERLRALLGPRESYELYAYGDGPGDHALLTDADHAWMNTSSGFAPWAPAR